MPSSEFSEPMTISSVSWYPSPGYNLVNFDQLYLYMGYCSSDQLTENFDANYISGTKTSVFERTSSFTVDAVYPWTTITLDDPFWFNPASGNLIIEVGWPNGDHEIYTFNYASSKTILVIGFYGSSSGNAFLEGPYLKLEGELALNQTTFASIKASFQ